MVSLVCEKKNKKEGEKRWGRGSRKRRGREGKKMKEKKVKEKETEVEPVEPERREVVARAGAGGNGELLVKAPHSGRNIRLQDE